MQAFIHLHLPRNYIGNHTTNSHSHYIIDIYINVFESLGV